MNVYSRNGSRIGDVIVTSNAQHEEEMMKSDFVRLSWSSSQFYEMPVGSYIIFDDEHYELLEPYSPEQKSECEFKYEPLFQHPKMYLGKVIFERPSTDTEGNHISYMEWPYTGSVSNLLNEIVKVINDTFGFSDAEKFTFMFCDFRDKVISIQFNSTDILSAISSIANQCECEAHLDWKRKTLFFGKIYINGATTPTLTIGGNVQVPSTNKSKDGYFNAFQPQGSTRNIMRKSQSEEFVQSDVRLNLRGMTGDPYPDGIIYTDGKGNILTKAQFERTGMKAFIKPLIFEEIYPKTDMYVYDVRYRERYRLDADETKKDRRIVTHTDDDGTKHYLRYANWFVKLSVPTLNTIGEATAWTPYVIKGAIRLPYNKNTLEFNDAARTIKAFITTALLDEMFTTDGTKTISRWDYVSDNREDVIKSQARLYEQQHANTTVERTNLTLENNPETYHWWEDGQTYEGVDTATQDYVGSLQLVVKRNGVTTTVNVVVSVMATYDVVVSADFNVNFSKGNYSGSGVINTLTRYLTTNPISSSQYSALKSSFQAGGYISITGGMNARYLPSEYTPSEIIDGTEPIMAFQTNTYKKKIGTDADGNDIYQFPLPSQLTGLGSGDGNGHYGFKVRSMKIEGDDYVTQANIRSQDEAEGDTGILDMNGNPAQVDINDFEIEFEENDKTILPSTLAQGIIPRGNTTPSLFCNKVNLYNIIVGSASEEAAKGELRNKTLEYIAESVKDKNADTLKSCPVMFEEDNPNLFIGQRIIVDDGLDMDEDRASHQKVARVQKLVTKIDFAFEQEITIGNAILKGNSTQTRENVEAIINGNIVVGGTSEAYVKSVVENYGLQNFLSKVKEDYAERLIGFAKGLWVKAKDMFGIDEEGNARLKDVKADNLDAVQIIASLLRSPNFKEAVGMIGQGFGFKLNGDIATLQTDNLIVLGQMIVNSLNIREVSYIGGVYILTPAGSTVFEVQPLYANGNASESNTWTDVGSGTVVGYRVLWLADNGTTSTMNFWQQGDQALCKTYNLSQAGHYDNFKSHEYWRLVCRIGQTTLGDNTYHYADLANTKTVYLYDNNGYGINRLENEGGTEIFLGFNAEHTTSDESVPEVGDKVVCLGSQRSKDRQAAIQLTAEGTGSIAIYDNINNFQLTASNEIHFFSKERVNMNARRFHWSTGDGSSVPPVVYRGAWTGETTTPYPETNPLSSWGDEWTYNDANWICIAEEPTYEPPGTTQANWTKSKGEKGEKGDNAINISLDNEHEDFIYSDSSTDPIAPTTITSQARLYDGGVRKSTGITWYVSCDGGTTYAKQSNSYTTGSVAKAKISSNGLVTVAGIFVESAKIKVGATYNNKPYYAELTINKTKQDKYDLKLVPDAIAFNSSETWSDKTITPSAERTDIQGNKTSATIITTENDGLRLYYSYVNANGSLLTPSLNRLTTSTFTLQETPANTYVGIYFELRLYSGTDYRMCDHETVEIVKAANGSRGNDGNTPIQLFKWSQTPLTANDKPNVSETDWASQEPYSGWYKHAQNRPSGENQILYLSQNTLTGNGTIDSTAWSTPIQISGNNGSNGEDGTNFEYIFILKTAQYTFPTNEKPANITTDTSGTQRTAEYIASHDDFVPYGWDDNPLGIDPTNKFEYMSMRTKPKGSDTWTAFSDPIIWSHWGRNGIDGDGTEYVFIRTKKNIAPVIANEGTSYLVDEWRPLISNGTTCDAEKHNNEYRTTDDPTGADETYPYEWAAKRNMNAANSNGQRTWKSYRECIKSPYEMSHWANHSESNLIIDLDNQEDQFGTDSTNKVIDEQVRSTGVSIYYGTHEQAITEMTAQLFYASDDSEQNPISDTSIAEVSCVVDSNDNTKGTVTVTIKQNAVISDTGLFAKITAKCARDTNGKVAYFNLGKVKSGAQGVSPTIYQLSLSQKSLSYSWSEDTLVAKNNSVTVSVKETTGNNSQIKTLAQSGKTCTWGFDGTYNTYTLNTSNPVITVNASNVGNHTKISIQLSTGDKEELPIVKDGKSGSAGQNAIRLALDNQHEDFLYSASQVLPIAPSGGAKSVIHLYDGKDEITLNTSMLSIDSSSSGVPTTGDNKPTIISENSKIKLKVPHITSNTAKVIVRATYNEKNYYAEFTANKTNQDKYDLYVRPNAISYNSATYTPILLDFKAERTDLQGNKTSVTISTSNNGVYETGKVYLFFGYVKPDGEIINPTGGSTYYEWSNVRIAADVCRTYVGIYYELRLYTSSSAYRVCDYETVEIAKSENGNTGPAGTSVIINGDATYFHHVDILGNTRPLNPTIANLGEVDLLDYDSITGDMIDVCEEIGTNQYGWEAYSVPVGTCYKYNKKLYEATLNGWLDLGQFEGDNGADGYSVNTIPSNVIIEQNNANNLDQFTLPFDVKFEAYKGGTKVTVTNVAIVGTPVGLTVSKKSGTNDTTTISAIAKVNNAYQRTYEYTARVSFDGKTMDVVVPVYITFAGQWQKDVKDGVEIDVATKLGFKEEGTDVYSIEEAGTFIRSWAENTSKLDKYVKGRNLIPNVLTGTGWKNTGVLDGGGLYKTGSANARTPRFNVNKNTGYVLSFYEMVAKPLGLYVSITIYYYTDSSTTTEYSHTTTYSYQYTQVTDSNDTTYTRKYKTITTPNVIGSLYAEIVISTISTTKPMFMLQLEEGSTPTPFDAMTKDVSSIVKQTAENIELKVGNCGLNIDEQSITAKGGKFRMVDSSNKETFSLDTNGNLESNGSAAFKGTLIATKIQQTACYVRPIRQGGIEAQIFNPDGGGYIKPFYYKVAISDGGYADEYVTEHNINVGDVFCVPENVQINFDSEHFTNCIGFPNLVVITDYMENSTRYAWQRNDENPILIPPPSTCPGVMIRFLNCTEDYAVIKTVDNQTVFHHSVIAFPETRYGLITNQAQIREGYYVRLDDGGRALINRETIIYSNGTYWIILIS